MASRYLPRTMEAARGARMFARMQEQPTTAWGILLQAVGGARALGAYLGLSSAVDTGRWASMGITPRHVAMLRSCIQDCSLQNRLELRLEDGVWFLRMLGEVADGR